MMVAVMPAIGIFLILVSIRLRAGGKLSADFCTLWGGAGTLLILAPVVLPPVRTGGLGTGAALLLCVILPIFLWGSVKRSLLLGQRQERRMERTLRGDDKKRLLFVVNTLEEGSAEARLLRALQGFHDDSCEVFLYALSGQEALFARFPDYVNVLNPHPGTTAFSSGRGRRRMIGSVLKAFVKNGGLFHKVGYVVRALTSSGGERRLLLWRVMAEGALRFPAGFDMAVAWTEGGAAYYVADWVKADKKAALLHAERGHAGDTRAADQDCWESFSAIFAFSEDVKGSFAAVYPEYASRLRTFPDVTDLAGMLELFGEDPEASDGCRRELGARGGS